MNPSKLSELLPIFLIKVLGEYSTDPRQDKYIKTELTVKKGSPQSENSLPKGKDHVEQKGSAKGSL